MIALKELGRVALRGIDKLAFRTSRGEVFSASPQQVAEFLSHARDTIQILAGELNTDFYTDPNVLQVIKDKSASGVKFEIIFGPGVNQRSLEAINEAAGGKALLLQLSKRPHHHFMIVDGKHALDENFHRPNAPLDERTVDIAFRTLVLAQTLHADFEGFKQKATPVRV